MLPQFTTKDVERFWSHVDKSGDCWLWTGRASRRAGYGDFYINGKDVYTHRFAYTITYGDPPADRPCVCHSCDVNYPVGDISYRRCVRPDHLFPGTIAENIRDAHSKGRLARGERSGSAKLTRADISFIRQAYAQGRRAATLAAQFKVSQPHINEIIAGKHWRWLS